MITPSTVATIEVTGRTVSGEKYAITKLEMVISVRLLANEITKH
jgi:hypothetical protein